MTTTLIIINPMAVYRMSYNNDHYTFGENRIDYISYNLPRHGPI